MIEQNISFFDPEVVLDELEQLDYKAEYSRKLDVVEMAFIKAERFEWNELFEGFNKLYAITYSSGIGFINELLKKYEYAEVIFGFEDVMSYNLQEIMAFQLKTIEKLKMTGNKKDLVDRLNNNTLKMFVAQQKISHEKIYILEADDGRKRVVMGSANMSYAAFSGRQRENICYVDGDQAFEWYKENFETLKDQSTNNISVKALAFANISDHMDELPISQEVKIKKALVIEQDYGVQDEVRFALDVKKIANKIAPFMPTPDKNGKVTLSPGQIVHTRRKLAEANTQEKEQRNEYPQLVLDIENSEAYLNDAKLDTNPSAEDIAKDVRLFMEYMSGYKKFHGNFEGMQDNYYAFTNWLFATPFMGAMRNMAVKYNQNLLPYPVFGLVYGKSKAGKTTFLETLMKMMIGQKLKMSAPDFTRSSIDNLRRTVKGAPIIVDDLTQTRFNQHAVEMIKNDSFGIVDNYIDYPAVVISANEDVKAVAPEIVRRAIICHVQAGLKNTELMKTSIVNRVQSNIGTAFYREYLRRMFIIVPGLLNVLKSEESDQAPDILKESSQILFDIISENIEEDTPAYIRTLTLDDYFNEKVTGSQAIKAIRTAWTINRKAFVITKKINQLSYNAVQTYEAERILKELPEDLEAHRSRECIVMNLDKAREFFGIKFKRNIWDGGLFK